VTYSSLATPEKEYLFIKRLYNTIIFTRYCYEGLNFRLSRKVRDFLHPFQYFDSPYNAKLGFAKEGANRDFCYKYYVFTGEKQ
jgi:hypothetical protein